MTQDQAYEIVRAAVQRAYPAKTVKPDTQVYGPLADMDSLDMVGAVVEIERNAGITLDVGEMAGTVTVSDLAAKVYELVNG